VQYKSMSILFLPRWKGMRSTYLAYLTLGFRFWQCFGLAACVLGEIYTLWHGWCQAEVW
jgi:hypothetical protein